MSVPAAYLGMILIWSTTPLAIKWSSGGPGFLTGVTLRMLIGLVLCVALIKLLRIPMHWQARYRRVYLISGMSIYGGMISVYYGAQFIPSGLVSVVFGLTPIIMGLMAAYWLPNGRLTLNHLLGASLGLTGLAVIFADDLQMSEAAILGTCMVLVSVTIHCLSSVWIKRIDAGGHPLTLITGGLLLAVPLFLLTWALSNESLSVAMPATALLSAIYLGAFGTVVGWALYYYVLVRISASTAALVTLITPVMALAIGKALNAEIISDHALAGTGIILSGLALHQWGDIVGGMVRRAVSRA